jgi:hypothetical protein
VEKYALYPGKEEGGFPNIHLIEPGTRYGLDETAGLEKTASGEHLDEVNLLVESIQPQPDRLYMLNSALGAGEYVGFNLRGDWFTEEGLTRTPPGWDDIPVWDIDGRRQAAHQTEKVGSWGNLAWGFPTFYNAHRFRHHVNKDPNRAYGYVLGAFWDARMRRVILVTELIRELCAQLGAVDLYDRIAGGEFPDTSMGAKVPYDICSICGNIARSPKKYCEHVRKDARPPYGMRAILPDGRRCGVYNTHPRFFDDSYVFIGAERSAKTMADLTDQVRGNNPYSQKIYSFAPGVKVAASERDLAVDAVTGGTGYGGSVPQSVRRQEEQNISNAAKDVFAVPEPDDTLEAKLSRLLSGQALSTPKEREALRYLRDTEKAKQRMRSGELSEREFALLDGVQKKRLQKLGISDGDVQKVRQAHIDNTVNRVNEKTASSTKWAEILKTIDLPAEDHLATIRSHEGGLPDLPKDALDHIAEDPGPRIRAAAQMGVVLRPHEFQYAMLKGSHPEKAEQFKKEGMVFRPTPIDLDIKAEYSAKLPVASDVQEKVASALHEVLAERSFAPVAVKSRLLKTANTSSDDLPWVQFQHEDPLLDEVSALYNEYRAGLVAQPPDWRYVPIDHSAHGELGQEEKLAASAIRMSSDLLHLAYWPALPVG